MSEYVFGRPIRSYEDTDFSPKVYIDSNGYKTIGIGHRLTEDEIKSGIYNNGIDRKTANVLFEKDLDRTRNRFYEINPKYLTYPKTVRNALEDLAFNMGPDFLVKKGWKKMQSALDNEDYVTAATELLQGSKPGTDSKYAKTVGQRAKDNAMRIAWGYNHNLAMRGDQKVASAGPVQKKQRVAMNTGYSNSGLGGNNIQPNNKSLW